MYLLNLIKSICCLNEQALVSVVWNALQTGCQVSALKMKEGKLHLQCFVPGLNPWTARKRKWIVCYQQFNWLYESTSVGKASLSFLISLKIFPSTTTLVGTDSLKRFVWKKVWRSLVYNHKSWQMTGNNKEFPRNNYLDRSTGKEFNWWASDNTIITQIPKILKDLNVITTMELSS